MSEALHHIAGPIRGPFTLASVSTGTSDSGTETAVSNLGDFRILQLQLEVTAAATDAGDKCDVYVQTTIDGTNWVDIVHFTQLAGNGGAKRYYAKIVAEAALTEFENATALGAAAQRAIIGTQYRVRWAITETSTDDESFTFAVYAVAIG